MDFHYADLGHWSLLPDGTRFSSGPWGHSVVSQRFWPYVDAAYLGYTFGNLVEQGIPILADLEKLPIPIRDQGLYRAAALSLRHRWIVKTCCADCLMTLVLSATSENKPQVIKAWPRTSLKRIEDAEEGYQSIVGIYEKKIYPASMVFAM